MSEQSSMAREKKTSVPSPQGEQDMAAQAEPSASSLGERILDAAETLVASQGLVGVKVRDIAAVTGCSVGSVYNAYADLDDLVIAVNRRTLLRLDAWLERASQRASGHQVIHTLAEGYLAFAVAETKALRALFEHRMADGRPFPEEHLRLVEATFSRIAAPLACLIPKAPASAVAMLARTLFSAVHGIIALGLEDRLVAVPPADLNSQVSRFIEVFVAGLAVHRDRQIPSR